MVRISLQKKSHYAMSKFLYTKKHLKYLYNTFFLYHAFLMDVNILYPHYCFMEQFPNTRNNTDDISDLDRNHMLYVVLCRYVNSVLRFLLLFS